MRRLRRRARQDGHLASARLRRRRFARSSGRAVRAAIASAGRRRSSASSTPRPPRTAPTAKEGPVSTSTRKSRSGIASRSWRKRNRRSVATLSGHPLQRYGDKIARLAVSTSKVSAQEAWTVATVAGMVEELPGEALQGRVRRQGGVLRDRRSGRTREGEATEMSASIPTDPYSPAASRCWSRGR